VPQRATIRITMSRAAKRPDLNPSALRPEPTFSPKEIGAHLGIGHNAVSELIQFGRKYGPKLHPTRGGLYPTFKGAKHRRIPLSALDRHKRHMARINGDPELPATVLIEVRQLQPLEAVA